MNNNARVRKGESLLIRSRGHQNGSHARGLSNADGRDVIADELHRVVNRQSGCNRTAWTVDVQGNIALRIFRFEKQKLRSNEIRNVVVDWGSNENDAVA